MAMPEMVEIIQAERLAAAKGDQFVRACQEHRHAGRSTTRRGPSRWLERESRSSRER